MRRRLRVAESAPLAVVVYCAGVRTLARGVPAGSRYRCSRCGKLVKVAW